MSLYSTSLTRAYETSGVLRKCDGKDKKQLVPACQSKGFVYTPNIRTLVSTFPSTLFNQANSGVTSLIPKIDYIHHMCMAVQLAVAGSSVVLVPANYWFRQIDLKDNGSGEVIQTAYDDTAHFNMLNRCPVWAQKAIFSTGNIESDEIGKYGLSKLLLPGTYTFFVPLLTSVFENFGGLFLADLQGDLSLTLSTPSTIIASGSGTVSAQISFIVDGQYLPETDRAIMRNRYTMTAAESQYLQPIVSPFGSVQLNAGATNNFTLNNVDGLVAYQAIVVRPVASKNNNTNFAQWQMYNIGDNNGAAIDLTNSSGGSIWGNGTPVPTRYMRQHIVSENFPNGWASVKPVYFINYAARMNKALSGNVDGARFFRGSDQDQIRLSLPAAPVQEVQTVTFSITPQATGFYSFSFQGEQSAQLAGNASVGAMKAAIEAMRGIASRFITVTCSAAASAGASFTVTFADPEGVLVGDMLLVNVHDGMVASASTARTVAAVSGLASGLYDVLVYSFVYHVANYSGSKLTSRLLL